MSQTFDINYLSRVHRPATLDETLNIFDLLAASDQTEINLNSSEIAVRKSRQDRQGSVEELARTV
jgi:hypothetical protein